MLELNCTYEESKKILELGYDFSKVCWKSLYEYRDQYSLNQTFIKIHLHGTHLSLASIEDEIKYRMSKYGIVDLVTPIIPKAALEACLPEHEEDGIWYIWLGYTRCMTQSPDDCDTSNLEYFLPNPDINSGFEAFRWCHENYPEELKAKFDEVMG